jgi:hypothetical protein
MGRKKDCKIPQFDNHTIRPVSYMFSPSTFVAPCKLPFTVQPNLVWASCNLHLNVKVMYNFYQDAN